MEALLSLAADWGTQLLGAEVTKMTIAFLIASRVNRSQMKKDIDACFQKLANSIDNVANSMKENHSQASKRIDDLSLRVDNLERD